MYVGAGTDERSGTDTASESEEIMIMFENIIGYEQIKSVLKRYCDVLKNPEKYKKLGAKSPKGILLHGGPGVGKTTMATALINESGLPAIIIRKNKPNGDFVDEIMKQFEKARNMGKPVIIFLDDLDKFANEDYEHPNAQEYVTVQSEIDNCVGYDVFVIATANSIENLPESLLRAGRFDKVLEIEVPDGEDAADIIGYYLEDKSLMDDVDTELVVRLMEGRSCAELESAINEAGIYAGYAGRDQINDEDFLNACFSCFYGEMPEEDFYHVGLELQKHNPYLRDVAVHETGHAVVAEILNRGSVNAVSIIPAGNGLSGVTSIRKQKGYKFSRDCCEDEVLQSLGGKAAVMVVLGKQDMGAVADMQKAFSITANLMDDFVKYNFTRFNPPSDNIRGRREMIAEADAMGYYKKACRIIVENRDLFDAILEELMEKKTLTYKDIARIREKLPV